MAIEVEKLIAVLEARMTQYDKALKKALGDTNTTFTRIEQRGSRLEARLRSIGKDVFAGFGRGALSAIVPILSATAAIEGVKDAMKEFGDIADDAKAAGLDPEFFQGIAYQMQLVGVEASETAGALATFAKNAGLAAEGKGRMVAQLGALNPALLRNIRLAETQEERIRLVADALAAEDNAATRAAISAAAFGDAGVRMAAGLEAGAAALDETIRKAREMGLVIDRDLVARADQLGDEFDTAAKVLDLQFKRALIELAPVLTFTAQTISNLIRDIQGLGDAVVNYVGQVGAGEDAAVQAMNRDYLRRVLSNGASSAGDAIVERGKTAWDWAGFKPGPLAAAKGIGATIAAGAGIAGPQWSESRAKAAAATIKEAEAVQQLIADLQFEQDQIGRTAVEQEIMNTLRQAGVERMSAEGQQIADLVVGNEALRLSQQKVADGYETIADAAETAGRGIAEALDDGKIEAEELLGIVVDVVRQLALAQVKELGAGGGVSGIVSALLSGILGGFANGTANTGGARGAVRGIVHGQEAVIPLPNGGRVPVVLPNGGGAGVPARVTVQVVAGELFDARVARTSGQVSARVVQAGLTHYDSRLLSRVREADERYG